MAQQDHTCRHRKPLGNTQKLEKDQTWGRSDFNEGSP